MTSKWVRRRQSGPLRSGARRPRRRPVHAPAPGAPRDEAQRRHEVLVCVRLTTATPGRHLLEHLRSEPCVVEAWWIAADVDAVVRLSADSLTVLHRAVADLRRRGGADVLVAHSVLRALDLSATVAGA